MRFAKLEQNIITAYFLATFDFYLQDKNGVRLSVPPKVDLNRHSAHKPRDGMLLKITTREK
jgi:sterol 14-demethylase